MSANKYELGRTLGDKALCIVVDGDTAMCTSGDSRLGTSEHAEHMAYLVKAGNAHDGLVAAAKAAIAYDSAIASCANDPCNMASFCTAEGDDLDSLYADWIDKSRAALAKAGAP